MSPSNIAFLVGGLIIGLLAFIAVMNAVKGTPRSSAMASPPP